MTSSPRPLRVVVAVLTYRRTAQLAALLPQLEAQAAAVDADGGTTTTLLVVDNDPDGGGAAVVAPFAPSARYVHEITPGIAAGRARVVDEAHAEDADVVVFIDDDEEPMPGWLAALLAAWRGHGRPAGVVGRVSPTFAGRSDPWIDAGGFFVRRIYATGAPVPAASSANLLLDLALLRRLGLNFDRRLGMKGGEDTLLTATLVRAGHRLVWCQEAEVRDNIPPERMDRRWVLRRAFSHGSVTSRIELGFAARPALTRVKLAGIGVARIGVGALRSTLGRLTGRTVWDARGRRLVHRGAGMVVGALGRDTAEYRRT